MSGSRPAPSQFASSGDTPGDDPGNTAGHSRKPESAGARVLYVITGLITGGAETALLGLLSRFTSTQAMVVSLVPIEGSVIAGRIKALDIPVSSLNLSTSLPNPLAIFKLRRIIAAFKPDIIHGWMYHGCLMANLAGGKTPVLWSIRQSLYDLSAEKLPTRAVIRLCALASSHAASILYNGDLALAQHEAFGFSARNHAVIPNGFDCDEFHPSQEAGLRVRTELGIAPDAVLIGLIGRYHPVKDHPSFFAAAGIIARQCASAHFLLAGKNLTAANPEIMQLVVANGLAGRVSLLGPRTDIPSINAALDIACSSSSSEGFSNTIGEAMASGVPCVATDVGETKSLIGDTGLTVPPRDPQALADALMVLIKTGATGRHHLGTAARSRIEVNFPLSLSAEKHEEMYRNMASAMKRTV